MPGWSDGPGYMPCFRRLGCVPQGRLELGTPNRCATGSLHIKRAPNNCIFSGHETACSKHRKIFRSPRARINNASPYTRHILVRELYLRSVLTVEIRIICTPGGALHDRKEVLLRFTIAIARISKRVWCVCLPCTGNSLLLGNSLLNNCSTAIWKIHRILHVNTLVPHTAAVQQLHTERADLREARRAVLTFCMPNSSRKIRDHASPRGRNIVPTAAAVAIGQSLYLFLPKGGGGTGGGTARGWRSRKVER